jgi:hypothetical protein
MTWLNGVGVDPSDVAILVTGRGLSKMAGFPTGRLENRYQLPLAGTAVDRTRFLLRCRLRGRAESSP